MKKTIATAALALTGLLAVPMTAAAGPSVRVGFSSGHGHGPRAGCSSRVTFSRTYISGFSECGCPIYSKRIFRGRDCYGRPIIDIVRVPFKCSGGCRAITHRPRDRVYAPFWQNRHHQPRCGVRPALPAQPVHVHVQTPRCR